VPGLGPVCAVASAPMRGRTGTSGATTYQAERSTFGSYEDVERDK
jgi:hypothetical protein